MQVRSREKCQHQHASWIQRHTTSTSPSWCDEHCLTPLLLRRILYPALVLLLDLFCCGVFATDATPVVFIVVSSLVVVVVIVVVVVVQPAAEPKLTRQQLDDRFAKVEREAAARRQEAVEDARERRRQEPYEPSASVARALF